MNCNCKYKIIADENIPFVREFFGALGDVKTFPAREICNNVVADADILLVRSVTKVNETLLHDSNIKFVGTATIGVDHVDQEYLKNNSIFFTNSAGSNANSVAEYVIAALLVMAERDSFSLKDKSIGIIGVGNIGSLVEAKAKALGMRVLLNDPPLARISPQQNRYTSLEEVLSADIITCHVPLIKEGADKTVHLISENELDMLGDDSILINSSRGPVTCNESLKKWVKNNNNSRVVLDVWENEPTPDLELLKLTDLATPHIAGYSFDGKVNGTRMLYEALCEFIDKAPDVDSDEFMPLPEVKALEYDLGGYVNAEGVLAQALKAIYNIEADDADMRGILTCDSENTGPYFDKLRKNYHRRREAQNTSITLTGNSPIDTEVKAILAGFGFKLD